jgi:predicted transcriptional regulator
VRISLTERETEFMEILWERGPSTVAEVRERLHDDPAYTTVLSILRTLQAKGYVAYTKDGHAHRYSARITRDAAQRSALSALIARLFKGSTELLLTHLVSDHKLTAAEIRRIRDLLDQQSRRDKR